MHIRTIRAIFIKQIKDILRNGQCLIFFIIYPAVAAVMTIALPEDLGQREFFIAIFATMHAVFSPIVATTNYMAEEKEKNTLRMLIMSNVSNLEYLISVGGFIFVCTMVSGISFALMGEYTLNEACLLMAYLAIGSIVSIILGMCIGGCSKNMMAANGVAVPIGMVFAFLPMLASFNEQIEKISSLLYGQSIKYWIEDVNSFSMQSLIVVLINFVIFCCAFVIIFKKNKLDV